MRTYSTMATRRLEKLAQKSGVECEIHVSEAQEVGRYFVMTVDAEPLKEPVPLGFTDEEAAYAIRHHRWERFILRGSPNRLNSTRSAKTRTGRYHGGIASWN